MARNQYSFEKRQQELRKKKKREEKALKKQEKNSSEVDDSAAEYLAMLRGEPFGEDEGGESESEPDDAS